jgi:hypothetical protein
MDRTDLVQGLMHGHNQRYAHTPSDSSSLFKRRQFDSSIIILCVRWYITYKLSYRDLRDMMAERGIDPAHTTVLRWAQFYAPEFEKKWDRFDLPPNPEPIIRLKYPLHSALCLIANSP